MTSRERDQVAVQALARARWHDASASDAGRDVAAALERGDVVFLPHLRFEPSDGELALFSSEIVGSSKNVGFDPATGHVGGTVLTGHARQSVAGMLGRFSDAADSLIRQLVPPYADRLIRGRTSFRPVEIEGRKTSWRKDDTRLHIDAFPATPVHGRRILRVFTNVNPAGRTRRWRVGERFEAIAERFAPMLRPPMPGIGPILEWLRVTKSRRTPYDALMLQLHDRMKADEAYQARCAQTLVEFPAGSTWIAFTDQVSHAAMAGQYQLEQTFMLPVEAMQNPERSPLRVLERVKGRRLV